MADFTISIANRLNFLGGGRPTLWGNTGATTMTWGVDSWGSDSEDYIQDVDKVIANSLSLDSDATFIEVVRVIANTLTLSSETVAEYLTSGIWDYIFPGNVTNAENRISSSYSDGSAVSTTYTTPSSPSTSWS